jgi:signal recognition particle subunit SEC65
MPKKIDEKPKKPAKKATQAKSKSQSKRLASQEPKKTKRKIGRPTKNSKELAHVICHEIATTPKGLEYICANNPDFPNPKTIFAWRLEKDDFCKLYTRAKQMQIEAFVNDIIEISDDSSQDVMKDEKGFEKPNHEYMQRSRMRVDSRKWLAAKLMPRLYGERIAVENQDGTEQELKQQLIELQAKLNKQNEKDY